MARKNNGEDHVKVFVGTSPNGEDAEACAVLEYTLRECSSLPVDIEWLRLSRNPRSPFFSDRDSRAGFQTELWSTPWTALRWLVPELCGWEGRAVYMDCANIVLGDVVELWRAEFPAKATVLARLTGPQLLTGVMVWDCTRSRESWKPVYSERPDLHVLADTLLRNGMVGPLPGGWGVLDAEFSGNPELATGSALCANPHIQPHQKYARIRMRADGQQHWFAGTRLPHYCPRLVELFESRLAAARDAGYEPEQYVPEKEFGPYTLARPSKMSARR